MPCTTLLVGKNASYDGSTIIGRNDDSPSGVFTEKKLVAFKKENLKDTYTSVISHVKVSLPKEGLDFTMMPNVDKKEGIWAACGVNEKNVGMTATETITSNARVLGADPLVNYIPKKKGQEEKAGGIGEEDLVFLVLPYIHSAREGVLRLGKLLEEYGTYESNGIAFSDENEIWWLESIGGHHWIAKKVPDDCYVVMPNQFGLDIFDFEDAYNEKKENLCSEDLLDFVKENHLALDMDVTRFNPRLAFGSHDDSDHVYNTPRAWFMERYFNPRSNKWDGIDADYTPESDDIPWCRKPERKITIEDTKYVLSSHYQGTPYDPYKRFGDKENKGAYRSIGISRTSFLAIVQIRPYGKEELRAIEWFCFASNAFNALVPFFPRTRKVPSYYSNTTLTVSSDNFYWASRLIGALTDSHYNTCSIFVERYQNAVASLSHQFINEIEKDESKDVLSLIDVYNQKIADMAKEKTDEALGKVLYEASCHMKNGYSRSDN